VRLLFISCLVLFISCSENTKVQINPGSVRVMPESMGVTALENISWRVGPLRRQEVSKGVRVEFTMPYLPSDAMETIIERYEVDSWLIRLRRKGLMKNNVLVMAYMPLFAREYPRGRNLRIRQSKKLTFRVHYHAAAVSTRFSNFMCPAFEHDLKLNDISVKNNSERMGTAVVSGVGKNRVLGKVEKFDYNLTVNGGSTLQGEYIVEMAFYNSEKKNRHSNWMTLADTGVVGRESSVRLKGCENFKIPDRPVDEDALKKFKFGR
jgi:hypothetical protein